MYPTLRNPRFRALMLRNVGEGARTRHMPKANAQTGASAKALVAEPTGSVEPAVIGTRERLVRAAASGIARSGWGAVTTRQVAALAGVNQALVHYHFGSMDALKREAALDALAREVSEPMVALFEEETLAGGLRRCLALVGALDPQSEPAVVLYESMLAAARDDELRAILNHALQAFRSVLAQRIAHDGGSDPEPAAALVAAALDGALLHRLVDPGLDLTILAAPLSRALGVATDSARDRKGAKR